MKRSLCTLKWIAAAVFGAALLPSVADAADLYRQPRSAPLGGYSWTGPYVGANLGYQWGSTSNSGTEPSGIVGGLQVGHNWQINQFVFGVETDIQASGAEDRFAAWKFSNPWFGTLRGRAGLALNNVLFYGTVGLAYGSLEAESMLNGANESKLLTGWVAGGGMEVALTGQWTARAEYLYVDLSRERFGLTGLQHGLESSYLRLGVNYRF